MITLDLKVEREASKPLARMFQSPELAHAYILGLEDGKRALGAQRLLGRSAWETLDALWLETKEAHNLSIPDPQ